MIGSVAAYLSMTSHRDGSAREIVRSISNAKQIGLALFEFENRYSSYPDASTSSRVKADTGSTWALTDATSNDLFQQLFVSGICSEEKIFQVRTPGTKRADNNISTEANTLEKGECSYAYVVGVTDPAAPLLVWPLVPGKLTFDREAFEGKAVILRADCSAISYSIDKTGHVIVNGMDLFDPRQPFWHGKAPVVKWPK